MNNYNPKTMITASIIGTLLGLGCLINHGIFEILEGNKPTNSFFIEAIDEAHRLDQELLEQIRLLSNIERSER